MNDSRDHIEMAQSILGEAVRSLDGGAAARATALAAIAHAYAALALAINVRFGSAETRGRG